MQGKPPTLKSIRAAIRAMLGPQPRKPPSPRPKREPLPRLKGLPTGIDYTHSGRFRARVWEGGRSGGYRDLGSFDRLEDAIAAYEAAKPKRGLPMGVYRAGKRFKAYVKANGERVHLGYFDDPELAGLKVDEFRRLQKLRDRAG